MSSKHSREVKLNKMWILIAILVLILCVFLILALKKPVIKVAEVLEIQINTEMKIEQPKTSYMFMDVTNKVKVNDNVNYSKLGEYEIEYEVPMLFNKYVKKQKVKVIDTLPPTITLEGGEEITQSYNKEYEELGVTAIDNYDGDVTESIITGQKHINNMELEIKYTATDKSGNVATKTRKVILIDDIAPNIELIGNPIIYTKLGNKYTDQGANATDTIDGDLTPNIKTEGSVDTSKVGVYVITYIVQDSSGNEAKKQRTVVVRDANLKATEGIDGQKGVIYLTFDDGPNATITPQILDILKRKNVKATFFILNYNETGEKLVQREIEEGHTVAIHGYSHTYKDIYKSVDTYMENITKLQEKIKASTGCNTIITRFPGGSSNTVSRFNPGIMTILTKEVVDRGYRYFDWNVSSGDAGGARTSKDVYNNVVNGLSKNRMNVVLMHDFSGNTKTVNALEDIIDYGINNGYTFARITENTPMVTHGVNN